MYLYANVDPLGVWNEVFFALKYLCIYQVCNKTLPGNRRKQLHHPEDDLLYSCGNKNADPVTIQSVRGYLYKCHSFS